MRTRRVPPGGSYVRGGALPGCGNGFAPSAPGLGGLDAHGSTVWVSAPCSDRVYCLDPDLSIAGQFTVNAPRGLHAKNGRLYVARWNASDVGIYDFGGTLQSTRPVGGQPTDVVADIYNVLHVADITHDVIHMSGVASLQFATKPGNVRRASTRYRKRVKVPAAEARFVRAIDRAGNAGRWRKITR